jgi:hypothetical protein
MVKVSVMYRNHQGTRFETWHITATATSPWCGNCSGRSHSCLAAPASTLREIRTRQAMCARRSARRSHGLSTCTPARAVHGNQSHDPSLGNLPDWFARLAWLSLLATFRPRPIARPSSAVTIAPTIIAISVVEGYPPPWHPVQARNRLGLAPTTFICGCGVSGKFSADATAASSKISKPSVKLRLMRFSSR